MADVARKIEDRASIAARLRKLPEFQGAAAERARRERNAGDSGRFDAAASATWKLTTLSGRLAELSSMGGTASLTLAFSLVLDAQQQGEPVGWVTAEESSFYPPDVAAGGIDLEALIVVRLPTAGSIPRATEHLARSGAFGLLVLDLAHDGGQLALVPVPMQMRLLGLAQKHRTAVLCLTRKKREASSLGSLISLRAEALREQLDDDVGESGISTFACTARILKDKRCGPGWSHVEVCRGPNGLC